MPGGRGPVFFFANLIETLLKYTRKGDVFKAEGIMVTHSDADHKEGVQKLLDKFPPNQDPSPGNAKFEFDGPLLFNSSAIVHMGAINFQQKILSSGDTIDGFESIFTFYFPGAKGELYYHNTRLPLTVPGPPAPPAPAPTLPPSSGTAIYNPDSSDNNKASILLNISDPNNHSVVQVSLNGDSVGYLVLKALQGKNPTVFKVPHHGSRKNSIPLQAFEPDAKDETSKNVAAHALLQFMLVPRPAAADLVVTSQITVGNISSFNNKFGEQTREYGAGTPKRAKIVVREGLKYDDVFVKLATEFQNKLIASGINVPNLLDTLQKRKDKIEENLRDTSVDSTQVYTYGMGSLNLPVAFDYDAARRAVLKDATTRDNAIKSALGVLPAGANLPYKEKDAFTELFKYLKTDRIFAGKVSLHLITSFYQEIKARTYFISSGDQHQHPNWQVVSGIIQAAQITRKSMPTYTCRLLLTSGNGIDEDNLPDNTTDDWTQYVSLQYFGGQTASVSIVPSANPMDVLNGAVEWQKGIPLQPDVLKDQYKRTAGALELKKLRSAALGKKYVVKPTGHNYWLNFVVDPVTNNRNFQLDAASATLQLTNTAFAEVKVGLKPEIVFTLTLENSSKDAAFIFGLIGSNVSQGGITSYKLFQKVWNAGIEEWHYFYVLAGALATSTLDTLASYFVFQEPPKGSPRVRRSVPAYSTPAPSLSNYLIEISVPPIEEKAANAILQLLLNDPDHADVPQSLQTGFFPKFLNWKVVDSSTITSTVASLIMEIPTSGNTIYSFVIRSAWLDVIIPEKRIDLLITVIDSGAIFVIELTRMRWTQDLSSGVLTLVKDMTPEVPIPTTDPSTLSLSAFLEWIDYPGDTSIVPSQTVLDLTVAQQVASQLLTSGKLSKESALYEFIKAMLSWNVDLTSSFEVLNDALSSADITLIQPSSSQQFKDLSVSSTTIFIKNPKTSNLSMKLKLVATDSDGLQVTLTYQIEQLIEKFVQAFQDYLRALGIRDDPSSYNLFDSVMLLLGSETDGFLSLSSFIRALVSTVFQWKVNLTTSFVRYASSPIGPKLLEATLAASIPDEGNTMDLGINKVFQLKSLAFKVPYVFQPDQENITAPHLTADITVGDKSARITAVTPQGDDLPSLKVKLTQSISLNDIVSFLGLDSTIANAHVPLLSSLLKDIQITTAGFTIQQKVLNSNQSWLSSIFFAVQFSNVGSYLPSAFSSLEDIEAQVVIYQPLLSLRKISVNVRFNFAVSVQGSDGNTENVNLAAILSAEPVQVTNQADSSYNFSVAIQISSNTVDPSEGLSLSSILTAFGLGAAVSSAESIPFIKSLLQNVLLRELRVTLNTASKSIQSFLLKVYIPSWKLFDNKVELSEFEIYLSYTNGDWATSFEGNAVFDEEYPITIRFDLVSDVNQEASFSFSNLNYDFTIQKFLSVFGLGSLGNIPVLGQVLSVAVTDAKLSLQMNDSGVIATEGQVSLYKESINLGSIFNLSQVSATIGFVHTEESNYVFGFSVEGFINQKVYLSVAYDPNTQVLSGKVLIASFQTADLSDAVGAFLQSSALSKNSVYSSVSDSFTAAISVAFEWKSGDFSLKNLIVDLRNVFSIGPINLEQLRFEYSKTDTSPPADDTSTKQLLPAGSQIKLLGVLTGKPDKTFSAIVEFDLNKDTTGASTITASIRPAKENTLTVLSFLSLFGITPPTVPTIEGQDTPNFFDLALKEGSVELSLPDYSVTSLHIKVETTNAVDLLDSPQITLENLSFEVNYSKSASPTTTGTLLGVITLLGIKIVMQGSKETNGTVFKAVVGPESADLQEFIKTLSPADTTSPAIPSDVGLPQPIPVYMAALIIGLLTDKKTITFKGASQLQWNIDLGFTNFQILELGGLVNYIKMRTGDMTSEFGAYVTGKFQFSSSILMEVELHFGANIDTALAVLVSDASQIKVDAVADNLLKFNQSKTPADSSSSSPSSSETPTGAIAFKDLLPSSTSSLVNLTSAYMNLNLSQSVFLLLGQIASIGSGFLLAGKFSPQQTRYGYAFGISLLQGFRFSQLLSALAPIDDIVQVRNATCVVMSMDNTKVNDVVEKMNAAKNSTILPEDAGGLVFPFNDLQLDDATKNLTIPKGMSFYAEFDIPALGIDSIFHSIIQISSSPDIPAVIISAMIASDPTESEFRAHLAQLTLLGLLEFNDVTLIYRPNSLLTLELHGTITIHLGDTSFSFYGSFTLAKTEAVFSVTSDPSKRVTIHEPLGMFGISLEDARLTLRYNFPEDGPKTSIMEIDASVNFYSSDSLKASDKGEDNPQTPMPVLTLNGLIAFRNYSPVVVSVTISPTEPLTIADLVATIFKWQYNLDLLNIGFVGGQIYYANLPEGENSITIDNVEYNSGYHISADTEIFDIVFTVAADIPLDKSQVSITGYANQPIDLGFAKFTGKMDSDPSQPDESRSPQLTFTTSSSSTSISIGIGLILFGVPLATADIGYNLTKKVFTGTLTYSGSIGFIQNPSISFEWSSESGFKVTSFPMSGGFDFDLLDKLKNYKDSCGQLVDLAFKEAVQTQFNINTNIAKTTQPDDFLAEMQITGTYDVLFAGKAKIASVPIPDLSVGIPREDDFSLNKLPQFILDLFTKNANRIVQQIIDNPERLAAILGIVALKTVTKKAIQTLVCRKVDTDDIDPDETGEDPTEDDFAEADEAETEFNDLADAFEELLELGDLGEAGAAAAGAEGAAEGALGILGGILGAIAAILAYFNIATYKDKKKEAAKRKRRIQRKNRNIRRKMKAKLDIKQAPSATFIPPNQLNVSWNPLADSGGQYHLVVIGTLLPPPGSVASDPVAMYDSVIPQSQQLITSQQFYNAVGISVTVNATLTATRDGHTSTFNGKSYTTEVPNVHPTLHAPAQVSATFEHNNHRILANASSVNRAKAYYFELVEGTDVPYTVVTQSTYNVPQGSTTISVLFDHSSIPSTANGPFKVRCQAVGESGSGIATSAYTYSTSLSLVTPPKQLTLALSHFEESSQDITLNWRLPQSTDQDSISGFVCRIVHKESSTVLVSYDVEKPVSEEGQPPPDIPTTHSFTIGSVVQALTSNNLIPDPPASIELEAQVNAVGISSAEIDSVFTASTITSLKPPEEVGFNFSVDDSVLNIAWKYTQETGTYGIEITDEKLQVVFSKSVTVNKDDSKPSDASEPDSVNQKVGYGVPYSDLSAISDPTVNYTVQLTAVTTGNENLDSLVPGKASNSLQILPAPTENSLQFNPNTGNVDAEFNSVPNASGQYLFQLSSGSTVLASVTITKPTAQSDPLSESVINGSLSVNSFIDQLAGGDQVYGTVQALGGGDFLNSSTLTFSTVLTVFQPPSNITYSFSPTEETITIACSQINTVSEYLLGLSNESNSDVVSMKDTVVDNQVSVILLINSLNQSDVEEWKVFAQSFGDATHLPSPRSFLENTVHVLPKPVVQQPSFDASYDVLTVTWPPVANAVNYSLSISAMKGDLELFSTSKAISAPADGQDVIATTSMNNSDPEWDSTLDELTSLTGKVVAIGADYYISSSPGLMPTIRRFDPPQNLKCGYDTDSDVITITCDPVEEASKYTLGLRSATNPDTTISKTVDKNENQPSVVLPRDDLRNSSEWMIFCEAVGDSTHFRSTETTLVTNVKVLNAPVAHSFNYYYLGHTITLTCKWLSVQGASEYCINVTYRNFSGQDNSFEVYAPQDQTSLQIDMSENVLDWSTVFKTVASIVATVKAVGSGHYITSTTRSYPPIRRLSSPRNVTITSDSNNVTITWSTVSSSTGYTAVVKVNGKQSVSQKVKENRLVVPLDELIQDSGSFYMYRIGAEITASTFFFLLPSAPGLAEKDIQLKQLQQSQQIGGSGGLAWNDPVETHSPHIVGIKAIRIRHADRIDSIQVTYLLTDGSTYIAPKHGGDGGSETNVEFDEGEEIVKVLASVNRLVVQLTFFTKSANGIEKKYGPFGEKGATPYQVTGKMVGVFGRSGELLEAIGFYMVSIPIETISSPTHGGSGGAHFNDPISTHSPQIVGIRALRIRHGDKIRSIQATYILEDGATWEAPNHGGTGDSESYIQFDAGEFITRVDGESEATLVDQLTFTTEKVDGTVMQYGPYGTTTNTAFSVSGHVIGLFGRSEALLDAIGFHYTQLPPKSVSTSQEFGGVGSHAFSDDISTHKPEIIGIKAITIRHETQVVSIQATYRRADGSTWVAPKHGGSGGRESSIQFADNENVIRMEGKTDNIIVDQLTFVSRKGDGSQGRYGPFGKTGMTPFAVDGKILGFFGRAGNLLDSVGVFYIP